jgi:hypothetical protein
VKQEKKLLTLGSAIPRDCTRITFCKNLTAANCTPACVLGAHMSSMIRLFARESVSHCGRSFLFVQLCASDTEILAPMTPRRTQKFETHNHRKRSGYAPANVCTAILTVQGLLSLRRPASMSRDRDATEVDNITRRARTPTRQPCVDRRGLRGTSKRGTHVVYAYRLREALARYRNATAPAPSV